MALEQCHGKINMSKLTSSSIIPAPSMSPTVSVGGGRGGGSKLDVDSSASVALSKNFNKGNQ